MTTGAGNDIEQATQIARKMVTEWGMSDMLGPMTFGKKNEEIFLGREIQTHRDYSEVTARMIDEEISRIVREAQRISEKVLKDNQDLLHSMAKALLKHETIDSKDISKLIDGKKIIRRVNGKGLISRKQKPKRKTSIDKVNPVKNQKKTNGRLQSKKTKKN